VANGRPYAVRMGPIYSLSRRLSAKGIGLLEFQSGLERDELRAFCAELADPAATHVRSRRGLQLGEAMVVPAAAAAELEALRVQDLSGLRADEVAAEVKQVQQIALHFAEYREVRYSDCDAVLHYILGRLAQDENLFNHLAEVREHNLFTYLHTTNVATLAAGFGLRLGLREKDARELGIAALLHDVGKGIVPEAILNKPGKLDAGEWEIVRRHPVEGARLLLKQRDVPRSAVVVAFEHHLHFRGDGGYPRLPASHRPSAQAQLVSIADTFDALFSRRSYHRNYDILEALELLQDGAGTVHDPWLVDTFTRFLLVDLESRGPLDFWSARRAQCQ
jgi:HD-GYP domain-containing protein (c-di-GMP phosphodiesterase class II)